MDFRGTFPALITPFRDGEIDFSALEAHVERLIAAGVSGLVPCGTTGESPTLTHAEHDLVIERVVGWAKGRVPIIAGTGSNSTAEAISTTQHAAKAGAQAALVVSPYYNKPSQEGLYQHFKAIAECSDLPIMLYNIPGRCGVEISLETTLRLGELPQVQAVKEATGKVNNVTEIVRQSDLQVLSGDDNLTLPMMACGAVGVVSVISNLRPRTLASMVAAAQEGDFAQARELHERLFPLMKAMFLETNPQPIKTAVALEGHCREEFRLPLCTMDPANRATLARLVEETPEL
jgi:4-hydroxy-tetrahydrodipicolinate synthase